MSASTISTQTIDEARATADRLHSARLGSRQAHDEARWAWEGLAKAIGQARDEAECELRSRLAYLKRRRSSRTRDEALVAVLEARQVWVAFVEQRKQISSIVDELWSERRIVRWDSGLDSPFNHVSPLGAQQRTSEGAHLVSQPVAPGDLTGQRSSDMKASNIAALKRHAEVALALGAGSGEESTWSRWADSRISGRTVVVTDADVAGFAALDACEAERIAIVAEEQGGPAPSTQTADKAEERLLAIPSTSGPALSAGERADRYNDLAAGLAKQGALDLRYGQERWRDARDWAARNGNDADGLPSVREAIAVGCAEAVAWQAADARVRDRALDRASRLLNDHHLDLLVNAGATSGPARRLIAILRRSVGRGDAVLRTLALYAPDAIDEAIAQWRPARYGSA